MEGKSYINISLNAT